MNISLRKHLKNVTEDFCGCSKAQQDIIDHVSQKGNNDIAVHLDNSISKCPEEVVEEAQKAVLDVVASLS